MNNIKNFIKGLVIGSTMTVPGVSGGTMALILGIYDDLIHSISTFFKDIKKNSIFLSVVVGGALIGLVSISFAVTYGIDHYEFPVKFLFLGIVLGGMPVLFKEANVGNKKISDYIFFIIGVLIIASFGFLQAGNNTTLVDLSNIGSVFGTIILIIAGFIIAIGLILPGISTSFLLLTLGLYEPLINAVKTMDLGFVIPIVFGVALGIITTTKILESFLTKKPRQTYLLIIGFVLASVWEVFPGIPTGMNILYSILSLLIGFGLITYFSKKFS